MNPRYDLTEIRRRVDDLVTITERLAYNGERSPRLSPGLERLCAEVEELAAALRPSTGAATPPAPRRTPETHPRTPTAPDYWYG